jgi:hypothetical protein
MLGYGPNKGIVPIALQEIFARIDANRDSRRQYQVSFSMLEMFAVYHPLYAFTTALADTTSA